jgi:hypothetical protein
MTPATEANADTDSMDCLTPGLALSDPFTAAWVLQVIVRIRRELCWLWRHPGPIDRVAELLERAPLARQRRQFFIEDATARYLDERLRAAEMPLRAKGCARGTLAWVARELELSGGEIFVVALALTAARDPAVNDLIGRLQADQRQSLPTLGLAQWLWEDAEALQGLLSPLHPLYTLGILRRADSASEWQAPFSMPVLVAQLLDGRVPEPLREIECLAERPEKRRAGAEHAALPAAALELQLLAGRMAQAPPGLRVVPVSMAFAQGSLSAIRAAPTLRQLAALTGRPIYSLRTLAISAASLESAGVFCWLQGADLLLPSQGLPSENLWQNALRAYPIYVYAAARGEGAPLAEELPVLIIAAPDYAQRRTAWLYELGEQQMVADPEAVRECAYRFRFDAAAIAEVVAALHHSPGPIALERMIAACQQQVGNWMGPQATRIVPRFRRDELILDAERSAQFDQLVAAMRSLSRVHADWGTGRVWGDAGISALFAGAPGTGKTMAAEVLAAELQLPLYHVDLSQVVNKFIGETEKNLCKLFDAAEQADVVLFFDEAESLFGARMQSRNANDRFANMEISYLLERMDRFRGLAILATNRRKDLDEAFLRRLRYVVEFPLPLESERLAIWKKSIPPQVSVIGIDFALLAHEFALSGGNIRSVVWNACLQCAAQQATPELTMAALMSAIDREYDKIGRPLTREQKSLWHLAAPGEGARPGEGTRAAVQ